VKTRRIKRLEIETTQGAAGTLFRESQFVFRHADAAVGRAELAISLSMPPRPDGYRANQIPPVLAMNLPEGFLRDRIIGRYRKVFDVADDMNLLALTSTPAAGRVWARAEQDQGRAQPTPVSLRELLAAPGTGALFDDLLERYATNTAISGIQPKVVVPEEIKSADASRGAGAVVERAAIRAPDLIVKSAGPEYPGLPENEYLCMSMARSAGLEVPECWLSDDRQLFVIRRFDKRPDGAYLGFEDLAALTGRHPSKKYEGSYGLVARALDDFCAPLHRAASLERFFRQVVFCCLIENGDAHLKNWGVLYVDPKSADADARLSPVYDLVCTTAWIPRDTLALGLEGTKAWPERAVLERFGRERCTLDRPGAIIDEVIEGALTYSPEERTSMWQLIEKARERTSRTLARR
jgi:serine/threonine-protein kinase HipA